jgi:hypothetical protein
MMERILIKGEFSSITLRSKQSPADLPGRGSIPCPHLSGNCWWHPPAGPDYQDREYRRLNETVPGFFKSREPVAGFHGSSLLFFIVKVET